MGELIFFPVDKVRNARKLDENAASHEKCKLYLFTGIRYERHTDTTLPPQTAHAGRGGAKRKRRQT